MNSSTILVPVTTALLDECLSFDHVSADSGERRAELSSAAQEGRMRVATVDSRAVGFSIIAPWFFEAPFLALVYVDPARRGRGIGSLLLEDFERAHPRKVFTSTNLSNAPMQRLLRARRWSPCGMLSGLDEGDPEIFFMRTV